MNVFHPDFPHSNPSPVDMLQLGVSVSGLGLGTVDYSTSTIALDERAGELFDLPFNVAMDRHELHNRIHPDDRPDIEAQVTSLLDSGDKDYIDVQHRIIRADGSIIWVEARKRVWFAESDGIRSKKPISGIVAVRDISAFKEAEQKIQFLMDEMNHRAKNAMAVIQGMVRLAANSEEEKAFATRFADRLKGLSYNHDALVKNNWSHIDLEDLIRFHLAAFDSGANGRVFVDGPEIKLKPAAAQALGMALHELATNAVKYGALSNASGNISIQWTVGDVEEQKFKISWLEENGPVVVPPKRKGFGQRVLEQLASASVGGTVELRYEETGLIWELSAALADISER